MKATSENLVIVQIPMHITKVHYTLSGDFYRKIFNVAGMLDVSWDTELLMICPLTIAEADTSPLLSCEARIKSDCYVKGGLDSFTSKSQSKIDNCLYRKYGYVETGRNFKAFISCSDPCVVTEIHASREFASGMNIVGVVLCSFGIVLILVGLVHYVIIPEEEEFSTIVMMTMKFLQIHLLEKKSQILLLNQQMKTLVTILPYHLLLHPMCRPTVELIVRIRLLLSFYSNSNSNLRSHVRIEDHLSFLHASRCIYMIS